jgi:hypothetical protein
LAVATLKVTAAATQELPPAKMEDLSPTTNLLPLLPLVEKVEKVEKAEKAEKAGNKASKPPSLFQAKLPQPGGLLFCDLIVLGFNPVPYPPPNPSTLFY